MKNLKDIILEKLKVSKNIVPDITFEQFIEEFQKMNNPNIYFERYLDLIGGDYPTFRSYPGLIAPDRKYIGKKFKNMELVRNVKGQIEVHFNLKRSINGTTGFIISNTNDLYNYLGYDQVSILYDLIKQLVNEQ